MPQCYQFLVTSPHELYHSIYHFVEGLFWFNKRPLLKVEKSEPCGNFDDDHLLEFWSRRESNARAQPSNTSKFVWLILISWWLSLVWLTNWQLFITFPQNGLPIALLSNKKITVRPISCFQPHTSYQKILGYHIAGYAPALYPCNPAICPHKMMANPHDTSWKSLVGYRSHDIAHGSSWDLAYSNIWGAQITRQSFTSGKSHGIFPPVVDHCPEETQGFSLYSQNIWLVVWTPLKNISQLGWLFPIYGKI